MPDPYAGKQFDAAAEYARQMGRAAADRQADLARRTCKVCFAVDGHASFCKLKEKP